MRSVFLIISMLFAAQVNAQTKDITPLRGEDIWYSNFAPDEQGGIYAIKHTGYGQSDLIYYFDEKWYNVSVPGKLSGVFVHNNEVYVTSSISDDQDRGIFHLRENNSWD